MAWREHAQATRNGALISEEDLQQAAAHIRSFYDNGTPLLDKQQLRRIGHEFAEASRSRTVRRVSVIGLDGVPVEFEVDIGGISRVPRYGRETVMYVLITFVHGH